MMSKETHKKTEVVVSKPTVKAAAKTKTPWWIWLIVVVIGLGAVAGLQYWKFTRAVQMRREATQIQRAKMSEFWKSQGLSDEAIAEKLKTERSENFRRDGNAGIFGMFRRMTGRGFGGGQGRGPQQR